MSTIPIAELVQKSPKNPVAVKGYTAKRQAVVKQKPSPIEALSSDTAEAVLARNNETVTTVLLALEQYEREQAAMPPPKRIPLDLSRVWQLNEVQLRDYANEGIDAALFFRYINKESLFSDTEWAGFLRMSVRTLHQYRALRKRFSFAQSERIFEVLLLTKAGIDLFHTGAHFQEWARTRNFALGGPRPVELMDSTFGIHLVRNIIGRIEHGVFS